MSIAFACDCGKSFSVAADYAGKRTKCPACGSGLTVPTPPAPESDPEPPKAESEEDSAYRALMESPDPALSASPPTRRREASGEPPGSRPQSEPPKIKARASAARKPARSSDGWPTGYETEPRRPAVHISSGVLGGAAMMLGAVIWFVVGLAAGILFYYPPVLFIIGLVTFVRALFGHED
jgi:hypothetical protein